MLHLTLEKKQISDRQIFLIVLSIINQVHSLDQTRQVLDPKAFFQSESLDTKVLYNTAP